MRKIRFTCLLAVIVAVSVCSGIAGADVIHSTFAAGDVFLTDQGLAIASDQTVAERFTVSGNDYLFEQLEFAAGLSMGPNSLAVSLRADNAGVPGSTIEPFLVNNVPSQYAGKMSVNSVMHPVLHNGSSYWIVMASGASNTYAFWPKNFGLWGTAAWGPGSSWTVGTDRPGVYRVSGSAVPEPSSLLAMLTGLGSLGGILRRKRR